MLQFILERANYWAIIGLMMVGLYIAFESANMIKKLVGLSIFQTSVFFFYITLGKVAGGSAPILYGKDAAGHGGEHGEAEAHGGAVATHNATATAIDHETGTASQGDDVSVENSSAVDGAEADILEGDESELSETELAENVETGLEGVSEPAIGTTDDPVTPAIEVDGLADGAHVDEPVSAAVDLVNPLTGLNEVYSNPLPHVLILTAIVVGVATLAVGLAIVVRIREAYGTIEADEVREMDIETADKQDADDAMGVSA